MNQKSRGPNVWPTWNECLTFREWAYKHFEQKTTQGEEFQAMLRVPGMRELLERYKNDYLAEKKKK